MSQVCHFIHCHFSNCHIHQFDFTLSVLTHIHYPSLYLCLFALTFKRTGISSTLHRRGDYITVTVVLENEDSQRVWVWESVTIHHLRHVLLTHAAEAARQRSQMKLVISKSCYYGKPKLSGTSCGVTLLKSVSAVFLSYLKSLWVSGLLQCHSQTWNRICECKPTTAPSYEFITSLVTICITTR